MRHAVGQQANGGQTVLLRIANGLIEWAQYLDRQHFPIEAQLCCINLDGQVASVTMAQLP
jgi:hypothetical protein